MVAALLLAGGLAAAAPAAKKAPEGVVLWVPIPGGAFRMDDGEGGGARRVEVPAFEMAKSEVTIGQYRRCVKAGACPALAKSYPKQHCGEPAFSRDDDPVSCISWDESARFSAWVGGRLPTEAEWEFAARGLGQRSFPWGEDPPGCKYAVLSAEGGDGCGRKSTWPVCSKPAGSTPEGLCDMAGNVAEWVQGSWHAGDRLYKGGAWCGPNMWARPSLRRADAPGFRDDAVGFRPVRAPRAH